MKQLARALRSISVFFGWMSRKVEKAQKSLYYLAYDIQFGPSAERVVARMRKANPPVHYDNRTKQWVGKKPSMQDSFPAISRWRYLLMNWFRGQDYSVMYHDGLPIVGYKMTSCESEVTTIYAVVYVGPLQRKRFESHESFFLRVRKQVPDSLKSPDLREVYRHDLTEGVACMTPQTVFRGWPLHPLLDSFSGTKT